MRKRFIALLLCGAMVTGLLAGCGSSDSGSSDSSSSTEVSTEVVEETGTESEETEVADAGEKSYDTHVSFSIASNNTITGVDYTGDAFYDYMADLYNVDIDVWPNESDSASEKVRLWINGGTMPDSMIWADFTFSEYYEYVDQGLLRALPDDWETTWPNLAKVVSKSGYAEELKVDGLTYGIPHAVFGNFMDMDPLPAHESLFFRKDWAEAVGMETMGDDYTITFDELHEYLEKVYEAGLTDKPYVGGSTGDVVGLFFWSEGIDYRAYIETDDGFIWCPADDSYPSMISTMREWYQDGYIDPDFYDASIMDGRNKFATGNLAAIFSDGACMSIRLTRDAYEDANPGANGDEDIAVVAVVGSDGINHYYEASNYWTVSVFNPDTDDETMYRILDMMDWFATEEGQISQQMGIPGVDWEYDENGEAVVLNEDYDGYTSLTGPFYLMAYCADDFAYSGLSSDATEKDVEDALAIYAVRLEGEGNYFSRAYNTYNSTLKKNYSVDFEGKIVELICDNDDIDTEWDNFIEENRNMWEPLLDELNEVYGY